MMTPFCSRNFFLLVICSSVATDALNDEACVACTVLLGIAEQNDALVDVLVKLVCSDDGEAACARAVRAAAKAVIKGNSPDKVCQALHVCDDKCELFAQWDPAPSIDESIGRAAGAALHEASVASDGLPVIGTLGNDLGFYGLVAKWASLHALATAQVAAPSLCGPGISIKDCALDVFAEQHKPLLDGDGDGFAALEHRKLRGVDWRGVDCDDTDASVHVGRRTNDTERDLNCNKIFGANASGSLEDQLCAGTARRGVAILGDSATAHFHIPRSWVAPHGDWSFSAQDAVERAANELDIPQCSWGTGHTASPDEECPPAHGFEFASLYTRLRERNRCNHNDFQNIGVNGARITTTAPLVKSLQRESTADHPMLVIVAQIGNDVCNGHPGNTGTTPEVFEEKARSVLDLLDQKLPKGSIVALLGLVDGRVLWDTLSERQHPIGGGARYRDLYAFLSCHSMNPCWGWLNEDESWRNATSERAAQLNAVYSKIHKEVANGTTGFANFDLIYYDADWRTFIDQYAAEGGDPADLFEAVDGFHPSQAGNMYLARSLWTVLEAEYPAIGEQNPHNEEIDRLFFGNGA